MDIGSCQLMSTSRKDECEIWNTCSTTEECRNTPGNFTCTQYTDVLVFKKMKAGLVNFFDKTWIDLEINFEDKTDSHWSCGILFKNVQYVFGGQNEIRQVSKVRGMFYRSATVPIRSTIAHYEEWEISISLSVLVVPVTHIRTSWFFSVSVWTILTNVECPEVPEASLQRQTSI